MQNNQSNELSFSAYQARLNTICLPCGPGSAARYRERLEELLAQGVNVEGCKAALAALNKRPPEVFKEKTPQERRVEELKILLANPEEDQNAKINISACIRMYQAGVMEFEAGRYYLIRDGELIGGPGKVEELDEVKLWFAPDRGNLWIEKCHDQLLLMPSYTPLPRHSPSGGQRVLT
ncbi:hypothetical protein BDZ91DRAFT_747273 [Kalaharituber pfeilii]|nr:hypothetical protein BDZ91DRAFT_747273 [Kalaharituber pfeilii]